MVASLPCSLKIVGFNSYLASLSKVIPLAHEVPIYGLSSGKAFGCNSSTVKSKIQVSCIILSYKLMWFLHHNSYDRYRRKHRELWWAFVDLEKTFDRVPRKVVEWAMRKLGVEEWLVRAVIAMYKHVRTRIRSYGG